MPESQDVCRELQAHPLEPGADEPCSPSRGALASCSPLQCPTRTSVSTLPRSGLAGQRDVPEPPPGSPGPPPVPGPCAEAHLLAACLPAVPLGSGWPPPSGSGRKWEGLEEVPQGGGLDCNCGRRKPRRRGRWIAELPSTEETYPVYQGSQTRLRAARGSGKAPDSTCGGGVSGPTEHSRLRWGQESHSPGQKAEFPFPLGAW